MTIGYDSRIKSDVFAKVAAGVFAANGVKVNIWSALMPVPTVSFATRYLHTSAGVMVTASHNPSKYNGYKVYGADGCQITTEAAAEILAEIEKLNIFVDVKTSDFEAGVASGSIRYIPDEVYTAFVEQVKSQSVLFGEEVNKDVAIVYSPLNGTGLKPVTRTLKEMGYTNITVVKEQEQPDGNFPTCPYPNPEIKEASCWIMHPVWMVCRSPMCSSSCWKITAPSWCVLPVPSRSSKHISRLVQRIKKLPKRWKPRFVRVRKST